VAQLSPPIMPWQHGSIRSRRHDPNTHRFVHLVRLAWDLHELGISVRVEMPLGQEMFLRLPTMSAADSKIVRAMVNNGEWWFSWSHRPSDWVRALDERAAMTVLEGVGR
jgi:hypothetical protein